MFKNELANSLSYVLSKKEFKDISKKLKVLYNVEVIEFICKTFENIIAHKVTLNENKIRILYYEKNPIFFENGNNFLPTVYLMNMFPEIVKLENKAIIYDETDTYLDNGADLMLKGVLNREEIKKASNFKLNDIFVVQTTSGLVTSIGYVMVSSLTLNINVPSGKFMKILHRIHDGLWQMGTKKIPEIISLKPNQTQNINENIDENLQNLNIETDNNEEEKNDKIISENNINNIQEDADTINSKIQISEEKMDQNINTIFLHLAKLLFKDMSNDDIFPLDPGKLLKEYMKPFAEELNLPLDFKYSSFKKINNYLKYLQKEKNLIAFGKPKGSQNDFILKILWDHPMILDLKSKIKKINFLEKKLALQNDLEHENVLLKNDEKIDVSQLYKPNQKLKPIFEKIDPKFDNSAYYTLKHCNEILTKYLKENDLFVKNSQGNVKLNDLLINALYKYEKDQAEKYFDSAQMDDIMLRWKKNLNEKSFITKTNTATEDFEVFSNSSLKVRIFARKIANKNVTIVDGLQNFCNVKEIIKTFAKHFACAVTLKDFQGAKEAVFIQGYWVSELIQIMIDEIKLKKEFIQVEDKLNKNKKKKSIN